MEVENRVLKGTFLLVCARSYNMHPTKVMIGSYPVPQGASSQQSKWFQPEMSGCARWR